MSTAQEMFEIYKALPKKVQIEVLKLLENEREENIPLLTQIEHGLEEVKMMQEGKVPKRNVRDLIRELRNE